MKPTPEQQEAIDFRNGNLQIIASAGSGKTTTITKRVAKLLDLGIKPEQIVAFTFTEKAAELMKTKIVKFAEDLGKPVGDLETMYVGTIHSYCFELLKKYLPEFATYDVLDDNQRVLFVKRHYYDLNLDDYDLKAFSFNDNNPLWETIKNFLFNVDVIREEMISVNKITNEKFKKSYLKYNELLEKKKYIDFSSMMEFAVNMLQKNFKVLTDVRAKLSFLIVDEYQDINPIQERLIELISTKQNVCVVGDDDQSIYNWRGTKVENILSFSKRYNKVKQISLIKNFRSSKGIIHHANNLISVMPIGKRLSKKMEVGNTHLSYEEGDIYTTLFPDQLNELDFIVNKIKSLHGKEFVEDEKKRAIDYQDFALIFRSVKKHAKPYIERFKKEGIPFIVRGSVGIFDRDEIRGILNSLKFVLNLDTGEILSLKNKFNKETFNSLFVKRRKPYDTFIRQLNSFKRMLTRKRYINLQRVYFELLSIIGIKDYEIKEELLFNLGKISNVIVDYESQNFPLKNIKKNLSYFFRFIEEYAAEAYEECSNDEKFGTINAVQIMTMHKCKGLEFPVVFLPSLIKTSFPKSRGDNTRKWFIDDNLIHKHNYTTHEEGQRRLLYVAMTRSMKYLFITFSERTMRYNNNVLSYYKNKQKPCEFIADFGDSMILRKPILDPTKRKESNNFKVIRTDLFPTNYSELAEYFECPICFKLGNIFEFKPAIDNLLGYGKSVHNIINIIHKKKKQEQEINIDRIIHENFLLRYANKKDSDESMKKAEKVVKSYLKEYKDDFDLSLETEKPFEIALGKAVVSGQIDLIRKQTPNGEEVTILEFKTEKNPEEPRKEIHRDQVLLYGLAYEKAFGKRPEKLFVHYLDEKDGGTREEVKFNDHVEDELRHKINRVIDNIREKAFKPVKVERSKRRVGSFKLLCNECG
jgi:DNA helicase-2/ATP-dependent DNA helicase PcrA